MKSFIWPVVGVLTVLASVGLASLAGNAAQADGEFCRITLAPIPPSADTTQSEVLDVECFDSAEEMGSTDSGYLLLELYSGTSYSGSIIQFTSASSCSGDYGYNDFNDLGWNDIASSAKPFCGRTISLWEHTYQAGARLTFSTDQSGLGVLNNASSSWDTD